MNDRPSLPTSNDRSALKWGVSAMAGFQAVPDALLVKQRDLDLDPVDLLVVLNITSYWWFAEKLPFARTTTIADRMGISVRTVQRSLRKLEAKGYITRTDQRTKDGDFISAIDPTGLVQKLAELSKADLTLSAKISSFASSRGLNVDMS